MELIFHKGLKFSTKCPRCYETIKFTINTDKFNISAKCKNGHQFDDISFQKFQFDYIKRTNYSYMTCHGCYQIINEYCNNFICEKCKEIFCSNCINKHSKEKKHNIRSNYINKSKQCEKHQKEYYLFCYDCKLNLCFDCKKDHQTHCIKSYFDIIPSKNEIKSFKNINKIYKNKLKKIIEIIDTHKKDIDKRYEKLIEYLNFLKNSINDKLIKEFNYSFFDYYNYENIKYCLNYLKNEDILKNNNYLDYLIFGKNTSKEKSINILNDEILKNENNDNDNAKIENKEIYKLDNYKSLQFFKNNIFMKTKLEYYTKRIDMFEFSQQSFKQILSYNLPLLGEIKNLKCAKYSNNILFNIIRKKNIKILEFDFKEKVLSLSKIELKAKKSFLNNNFLDFIDDKNENIITVDKEETSLWKRHNKIYGKIKRIKGEYDKLYNISDTIFCAVISGINSIYFFSHDNFQLIKSIKIDNNFEFIGVIKNELLCIREQDSFNLLFIDLKYLDIVIIKELQNDVKYIKIIDNYLLQCFIATNNLKIQKDKFNFNEKYFENKGLIEKNIHCSSHSEILVTDNGYFIVSDNNNLYIFKS